MLRNPTSRELVTSKLNTGNEPGCPLKAGHLKFGSAIGVACRDLRSTASLDAIQKLVWHLPTPAQKTRLRYWLDRTHVRQTGVSRGAMVKRDDHITNVLELYYGDTPRIQKAVERIMWREERALVHFPRVDDKK